MQACCTLKAEGTTAQCGRGHLVYSRARTDLWACLLLGHELIKVSQIWLLRVLLQTGKVLGQVLSDGHGARQLSRCLTW